MAKIAIHKIASQSKAHSIIEALINIGSGFLIAFCISQAAAEYEEVIRIYIWDGFRWDISAGSNFVMTTILTIVSITRSLIWRRIFNHIHIKKVHKHYGRKQK